MEEQTQVLTKRERKELRKQQKEQERLGKEEKTAFKKRNKRIVSWSVSLIIIFLIVYGIYFLFSGEKIESHSNGEVHWHSRLNVFVCGNEVLMPSPSGEHHVGLPLLHTHEDRLIHIEGIVWKPEDITLGKYMEAIGRNFKGNELLDKKNGNVCNNLPGKVKFFVNGKENFELTNYVIKDGENYELRFE